MSALRGRTALVTGAARGLGRAYALRLAAEGARVAVVDLLSEEAADTVASIEAEGGEAAPFLADVSRGDQVQAMVEEVIGRFGGVDVLVNNAGGALIPSQPFEDIPEEQWERVVNVNLKGQWLCARAVASHMKGRRQGKIVNVASAVVFRGYPAGLSPYIAAKAGVIGLTRALAQELGPYGVTVNALAPGYTPVPSPKTVFTEEYRSGLARRMIEEQCLKRAETPADLAEALVFLASPASAFITGQVLNVDGGWAMP